MSDPKLHKWRGIIKGIRNEVAATHQETSEYAEILQSLNDTLGEFDLEIKTISKYVKANIRSKNAKKKTRNLD